MFKFYFVHNEKEEMGWWVQFQWRMFSRSHS